MAKSNRGSLYGSVSGGDGAPVAIVVFSGKTLPTAKQKKKPVAVSNIDGTGHFLIPSLAPGDYVVLAVEQGGGSATARATIVAGKATAVFLNLPPEAS